MDGQVGAYPRAPSRETAMYNLGYLEHEFFEDSRTTLAMHANENEFLQTRPAVSIKRRLPYPQLFQWYNKIRIDVSKSGLGMRVNGAATISIAVPS